MFLHNRKKAGRFYNDVSKRFKAGQWQQQLVEDAVILWQEQPNHQTLSLLISIQHAIRGFSASEIEKLIACASHNRHALTPSVLLRLTSLLSSKQSRNNAFEQTSVFAKNKNWGAHLREGYYLSRYPLLLQEHQNHRHAILAQSFCNRLMDWDSFVKTMASGSTAIVGNATTELGKKQGDKINASDHVFRFNSVNTEANFVADYGTKTTAWVISPSYRPEPTKLAGKTLLISGIDPFLKPTTYWRRLAVLPLDTIVTFPRHVWYQLVAELESPPTAGLLTLASLLDAGFNAKNLAVYGLTRTASTEAQNHYGDSIKRSSRHNWQREASLVNRLWTKLELPDSAQAASQKSS